MCCGFVDQSTIELSRRMLNLHLPKVIAFGLCPEKSLSLKKLTEATFERQKNCVCDFRMKTKAPRRGESEGLCDPGLTRKLDCGSFQTL